MSNDGHPIMMRDIYPQFGDAGIFGAMIYIDNSETKKYKVEDIEQAIIDGREHYRRRAGGRATGPYVAYASPNTLARYGNPDRLAQMNVYPDAFWPIAHVWVTEIANGYVPVYTQGVQSTD